MYAMPLNISRIKAFKQFVNSMPNIYFNHEVWGLIDFPQYNRMIHWVKYCNDSASNEYNINNGPVYNSYTGWKALSEFFGITVDDAVYLFSATSFTKRRIISKKEVLRQIDSVVNEYVIE